MECALDAYIQEILKSPEYKEYAKALDRVKLYPDLKAQIDEFRTKNFEMQRNKDAAFDKLDEFEREYGEFMDLPEVSGFLEAELAFCRMMQQNNNVIMDAIRFE